VPVESTQLAVPNEHENVPDIDELVCVRVSEIFSVPPVTEELTVPCHVPEKLPLPFGEGDCDG
jgi:hypothetical protein